MFVSFLGNFLNCSSWGMKSHICFSALPPSFACFFVWFATLTIYGIVCLYLACEMLLCLVLHFSVLGPFRFTVPGEFLYSLWHMGSGVSLDSMSVVEQRLGLSLLLWSSLLHAAWDAGCSFFFFFLIHPRRAFCISWLLLVVHFQLLSHVWTWSNISGFLVP